MKKPTFLQYERPLLVAMLQAKTPERIKELLSCSLSEGAEAFGMQFEGMKAEYRNRETYRELFALASPLPVYVTNYRRKKENQVKSDEELAAELLELAECGATLCDVMGDFFDPQADEFSVDAVAVQKQRALIDALHARGAEVLMSSHVLKFTPAERVLEIARAHEARGADICKIVTGASNMDEQIENLRIVTLLKRELHIPFLFLTGGENRISRRLGGALGNCMTLCVHEYDEMATAAQPLLTDMVAIRDLI